MTKLFELINTKFSEEDFKKKIYRYISFESLLQMFTLGTSVMVPVTRWDDPFEGLILNTKCKYYDYRIKNRYDLNYFYGQSWSLNSVSDALWRIYSHDRKGLRIRTTIGKLLNSFSSISEKYNEVELYADRVSYKQTSEIVKLLQELDGEKLNEKLDQLLFNKRNSFKHENEVRLIAVPKSIDNRIETVNYEIDPLKFIDSIMVDSRADEYYFNIVKDILTKKFNYPEKNICQSKLYYTK